MGGKMIKKSNHYLTMLYYIVTGMSGSEFLDYVSMGLDKLQQLVYTVKSEVINYDEK